MVKYYVIKNGGTVATTADEWYTLEQIVAKVADNQFHTDWWCYYEDASEKMHKIKIEKLLKKFATQEETTPEVQQTPQEEVPQEAKQASEVPDAPEVPKIPEATQANQEEATPEVQKENLKEKVDNFVEDLKEKFNKFLAWMKVWTIRASIAVSVISVIYIWCLHLHAEKEIKLRDEANIILVKTNSDYENKIKTLEDNNANYESKIKTLEDNNANYESKIKTLKSDIENLKTQSAGVPVYSGKTPMSDEIINKRRAEFADATQEYLESLEDKWYLTESWRLSRQAEALAKWGKTYERLFIYAANKASKGLNKKDYTSLYALYVASAIYTGHIDNPDIGLEEGIKMCNHNWKSVKDFVLNLEMEPHHRAAIEAIETL